MKSIAYLALCAASALSACAYVTSKPVTAENRDVKGIRYYDVRSLLIISGGSPQIHYIPDPNKERVLRFGAFLATNHMKLTLGSNGTLQASDGNLDGTAVVDGLLKIFDRVVEDALSPTTTTAAGAAGQGGDERIYDFVCSPDDRLLELRE